MFNVPNRRSSRKRPRKVDLREQLFNEGAVGPTEQVQVSEERITALRGILFDLDPNLYREGPLLPAIPSDPREFYEAVVRAWLRRDPVLSKAEVRSSGRGLHVILRFAEPIQFCTAGERDRWAGIVEVVQAALPVDPDQPGITATTRAIGSVNSKNGVTVELLSPGEPVTEEEALQLFERMVHAPFRTLMKILIGEEQIEPCPICGGEGTTLSALDFVGRCYGSCGKVKIDRLYDLFLQPRQDGQQGVEDDA